MHEIVDLGGAMGSLLAAWSLSTLVCIGLGLAWQRALGADTGDPDSLFMSFWLGFAVLLWCLQLWHFFLPITAVTTGVLTAAGCASLVWNRARLRGRVRRVAWPGLAALLVVALWVARLAVAELRHYDTGLYLLGGLDWVSSHPLVPGLGNLHGRFAFNNANLLYAALLDVGPWTGRAPNLVNGSLLIVALAQSLACGRRLLRGGTSRAADAFGLVIAVPALLLAKPYLVSLSTDLPATLLAMIVAWRCFAVLTREGLAGQRRELWNLSLLAAAAVCVKLSSLVFVGSLWVLAASIHFGDARTEDFDPRRGIAVAVAIVAIALSPWLVRGLLLSGYPLYPSTLLSLPVEWRIPGWLAAGEADAVRSWARVPGVARELTLEGWYWLPSWTRRHVHLSLGLGFVFPLLVGGIGVFLSALAGSLGRRPDANRGLWLLAPGALGFGFWFWTAPDPRFATFVFWSIAATGLAVALGAWDRVGRVQSGGLLCVALAVLVAAILPRGGDHPGSEGGFPPVPRVSTDQFETESGLILRVPVGTDQCWGAPQPCTPYPRAELHLRRPGDLRSGFVNG